MRRFFIATHFTKALFFQLLIVFITLLLPLISQSKVLFEGKYKILFEKKEVGFVLQKYEYNPVKKQFTSKYFVQINSWFEKSKESLVAVADKNFKPIYYAYKFKQKSGIKKITASFSKNKAVAKIYTKNTSQKLGITKTITKKIPKGVFLSTFLNYLILNDGLILNKKMKYQALSEEHFSIYTGEAHIKNRFMYKGRRAYKIKNMFNNSRFSTFLGEKGQSLYSQSSLHKISTELQPLPPSAAEWLRTF